MTITVTLHAAHVTDQVKKNAWNVIVVHIDQMLMLIRAVASVIQELLVRVVKDFALKDVMYVKVMMTINAYTVLQVISLMNIPSEGAFHAKENGHIILLPPVRTVDQRTLLALAHAKLINGTIQMHLNAENVS
jgi:hypothetical protein